MHRAALYLECQAVWQLKAVLQNIKEHPYQESGIFSGQHLQLTKAQRIYVLRVSHRGTSGNDGDYVYTLSQDISASPFPHASMDWNASTGGVIFSSPAIGGDGSTYIGSNDNKLHALIPTSPK